MPHIRAAFAALLFSLALLTTATAQPPDAPKVTGLTKVAQGKLLRLKVELAAGESAQWMAFPLNKVDFDTEDNGARFRGTGEPGVYDVIVDVYGIKKIGDNYAAVSRRAVLQVEITGTKQQKTTPAPDDKKAKPAPVPDDKKANPKPAPGPAPENVGLFLIVVEDGVTRTTDAARVMGDRAYWARLQERGHAYEHYKLTSPEVTAKGYKTAMDKLGVSAPALIVATPIPGTEQATFRACVPLPKNTTGAGDTVDAVVGKYSTK